MSTLEQRAKRIRANCIKMSYEAKEGHLGSALSCVDILVALYEHFDLSPYGSNRDKLYFSKGHACSALYATMAEYSILTEKELDTYAKPNSRLLPHPDNLALPLLKISSGSLGHGLGVACGAALALKQRGSKAKCVVVMGDGECNEGSVWEAAQFAAAHRLDNLLVVVDYNGIQSIGRTDEIAGGTSLADKFWAFGWGVLDVDGSNLNNLPIQIASERLYKGKSAPQAIIARTQSGISFINYDDCLWHYRVPSWEEYSAAMTELGIQSIDDRDFVTLTELEVGEKPEFLGAGS